MSFASLGLNAAILKAVAKQGYDTPSPIQEQAIPAVLKGLDVMAAAQTGTGKTAGFTLPILELLSKGTPAQRGQVRALVLTPTRELAAQVEESVATYGEHLPLKSAVVFGGVSIQPQLAALKNGVDILVATPGRLLDLCQQKAVNFSKLEILVLDEADRMLDMGFIRDIKKVLALLPPKRQNLMFSATFSDDIRELAKGLVNNPVEISVTPRNATATTVQQCVYPLDKTRKSQALIELIQSNDWKQVLVFSRTKHGANRLAKSLDAAGITAAAIHGNKSQTARTKALADFKAGVVQVMVATDIAARGIDIDQLPYVVNFDLPNVPEDYVHRIGRTGRAGASGQAISLVGLEEVKLLHDIERLINRVIERKHLAGFEAPFTLPEPNFKSSGGARPKSNTSNKPRTPRNNDASSGDKPARKSDSRPQGQGRRSSTDSNPNAADKPRSPRPQREGQQDANNKPSQPKRSPRRSDNTGSAEQSKNKPVNPYATARIKS